MSDMSDMSDMCILCLDILKCYMSEYIEMLQCIHNITCIEYVNSYNYNDYDYGPNKTYIIVQRLPDIKVLNDIINKESKIIVLNTEQASLINYNSLHYHNLNHIRNCINLKLVSEIWDYSKKTFLTNL